MGTAAQVQEKNVNNSMSEEVLAGLSKSQKTLPSKYFYDKRGSALFEDICELDEYYLTRTELEIMNGNIDAIAAKLGENIQLIELGSGSSVKTRLLLDHLNSINSYIPVDISDDFLAEVAENLQGEYPVLDIIPVAADYTQPFELPRTKPGVRKIAYYPGSTIGNFTKENAAEFLALIADLAGEDGGLLIGFDLLKEKETLVDAYDDSKGVTAEFNKNILLRLNRELNANFDLDLFEHRAVFNEEKSRMEMHLESKADQFVNISDAQIHFEKGETIHTENSHKYSLESFKELTESHFRTVETWTDPESMFAIQFLESK
ncbi:L-histidine N(alpha)-methyltransferase [Rhodohalobacter sp.]|uniref:L-histidine N(alpha)-methyltransferase n=1 Tax=Rhodohalobacter sp. TaxID=1974210 RepID=UPI002ACEEB1A|nr:L-histidine N(alpha)-methyltransferase [Rhodohalobacter sp.]MDZ7755559.1 L-histidine N(alpha)-methyltransferase [Rhodohalobacter sp.]